jgi:hypothetical protein
LFFLCVRLFFSFYPGRLFNFIIFNLILLYLFINILVKTHTDASKTTFHPATQLLDFLSTTDGRSFVCHPFVS